MIQGLRLGVHNSGVGIDGLGRGYLEISDAGQ